MLKLFTNLLKGLFRVIKATVVFLFKGIATLVLGAIMISLTFMWIIFLLLLLALFAALAIGPFVAGYLWLRNYIFDTSLGFKGVIEPVMFIIGLITIVVKIRIHYKRAGEDKLNPLLKSLLSLKADIEMDSPYPSIRQKIDALKVDISYAGSTWRYLFNEFADKYAMSQSKIITGAIYNINDLTFIINGVEKKYRMMTNVFFAFKAIINELSCFKDFQELKTKLKGLIEKVGFASRYLSKPEKATQIEKVTEFIG